MNILPHKAMSGFVIIVDINSFTKMVAASRGSLIAQFTRDVLAGAISVIEEQEGEVVGFMGDAIPGIVSTKKGASILVVRGNRQRSR